MLSPPASVESTDAPDLRRSGTLYAGFCQNPRLVSKCEPSRGCLLSPTRTMSPIAVTAAENGCNAFKAGEKADPADQPLSGGLRAKPL